MIENRWGDILFYELASKPNNIPNTLLTQPLLLEMRKGSESKTQHFTVTHCLRGWHLQVLLNQEVRSRNPEMKHCAWKTPLPMPL